MSRFYNGQPVVCVWTREEWMPIPEESILVPEKGSRYVVVRSMVNRFRPIRPTRVDVELRESAPNHWYDERGFEPITENQVRALEAIATDVPDEIRRELQDA